MTNADSHREPGMPEHVKALITALAVAGALPMITILAAMFIDLDQAISNAIFFVSLVVVLMLLIRWFVIYRRSKETRR